MLCPIGRQAQLPGFPRWEEEPGSISKGFLPIWTQHGREEASPGREKALQVGTDIMVVGAGGGSKACIFSLGKVFACLPCLTGIACVIYLWEDFCFSLWQLAARGLRPPSTHQGEQIKTCTLHSCEIQTPFWDSFFPPYPSMLHFLHPSKNLADIWGGGSGSNCGLNFFHGMGFAPLHCRTVCIYGVLVLFLLTFRTCLLSLGEGRKNHSDELSCLYHLITCLSQNRKETGRLPSLLRALPFLSPSLSSPHPPSLPTPNIFCMHAVHTAVGNRPLTGEKL